VLRSDGTIYFTDPDWQLEGGEYTGQEGPTRVYRVTPEGEVSVVDGSLDKPNGIALSPDEKTLYVSYLLGDAAALNAYAVADDGSTGDGQKLADFDGVDGLAVDCAGNVYVTAGDIEVLDAAGSPLGTIDVPGSAGWVTNVAFGGPAGTTLYVTADNELHELELNLPGFPY
jgi:gluconolactonase